MLDILQPNYNWSYGATMRQRTDYIVLHHVGANGSFTPEQIHQMHLANGWRGIGYNFYVRRDGTIYHGREENAAGGHTKGYNSRSVGVCFEGNFENETMSEAQIKAGQALVKYLKYQYPRARVVRHRDLNATACPGKNFPFDKITNPVEAVSDEPADWAKEAFDWAIPNGIIKGDERGMRYNDPVTRQEFITMLYRYNKLKGE